MIAMVLGLRGRLADAVHIGDRVGHHEDRRQTMKNRKMLR
jgi:hypothetical protein